VEFCYFILFISQWTDAGWLRDTKTSRIRIHCLRDGRRCSSSSW
jgi:hypothetical protein